MKRYAVSLIVPVIALALAYGVDWLAKHELLTDPGLVHAYTPGAWEVSGIVGMALNVLVYRSVGVAIVLGGTLGNVLDALPDGSVENPLTWREPTGVYGFNPADVAIQVGYVYVAVEVARALIRWRRRRRLALEVVT